MNKSKLGLIAESLKELAYGRVSDLMEKLPSDLEDEDLALLVEEAVKLIKSYSEAQKFLEALSDGRLEVEPPARNYFISPFKQLHANLKHLTWQTQQVAKGDFNQKVDFLGDFSSAFNSMIESLKEKRLIESALEKSHEELKEANSKILDSIDYAGSIQSAILPPTQQLDSILSSYFVIWNPRDVLGGDIYWLVGDKEEFAFAVVDCTGHGVPGAIMTMMAVTSLKRAEHEIGFRDPGALLERVNILMRDGLRHRSRGKLYDDGMDIGVCYVDRVKRKVIYSGAHVSLYVCCDDLDAVEIKGNNHSLGYKSSNPNYRFTNRELHLPEITDLYLTTDGLIDQIGFSKGLPFGKRRFKRAIVNNYGSSPEHKRRGLLKEFETHMGDENQRDDVTVFAISL